MTRLILETDNEWTKRKIKSTLGIEIELLTKAVNRCQMKLDQMEQKYGKFNREALYTNIDDMELVEWEGEIETLHKLKDKLSSLEEISFEYK
jgi:hypothetical protein